MKTDVIKVSGKIRQTEEALEQADKVIAYKELTGKNALHLRLLTEEMMGMVRSITGATEGRFWIEDEDGLYQLHLAVYTRMDSEKREKLMDVSTSGKNESAKGLMGRLRDFFDRGDDADIATFSPLLTPGLYENTSTPTLDWEWSMNRYEEALSVKVREENDQAKEAWDELEKSVVAHVADDVKVYIRGDRVEMVIEKRIHV